MGEELLYLNNPKEVKPIYHEDITTPFVKTLASFLLV